MLRFVLAVALVVVLMVVTLKLLGHRVPVLDYPLGPMGAPVIQPQVQIQPPGYDVNLP
jgi:hypothetical protein